MTDAALRHVMITTLLTIKIHISAALKQLYARFYIETSFQNNSDDALASVSFPLFPQTSVLGVCEFSERVRNPAKTADRFTAVQLRPKAHILSD